VITYVTTIILCVSSSRDVRNRKYTRHEPRQLQEIIVNQGPPYTCNLGMSTFQTDDGFTQGDGIVFAMKSKEDDDNGVKITSFAFNVPAAQSQLVEFQVYSLKEEGYYADPIRDTFNEGVSYDHRGQLQMDLWEMISSGTIQGSDLSDDLYVIPFEKFSAKEISPNGGVRSFYINTTLLYTNPMTDMGINDAQPLVGYNDPAAPELLVGEGASGFSDTKLLYKMRQFVGNFSYETDCATEAPSMSPSISKLTSSPTSMPSHSPTDFSVSKEQAGAEAAMLFPLLKCDPNQKTVPKEVLDALNEQIVHTVSTGDKSDGYNNIKSTVLEAQVRCVNRRLIGDENQHNRLLATQSSAMEFSLVITGDYRSLDGKPPDMGPLVEDSINADATKFTKELKDRSSNPLLEAATEPQVQAKTLDSDSLEKFNNNAFEVTVRAFPSPSPTAPPQDTMKTALLIVILIVSGVMVVLAAFLMFKHAERRAIESRRRKMERISEQKVSALEEKHMKLEWEKENQIRMASNNKQRLSDYPPYYGGPPPQHQGYSHARDHSEDNYEENY